ncbi:MAG: hypothetical protein E5Y74_08695 [Mesorhizobium sp.]|nr:MAG: hypothetical protein E5Y74_08695 [Mesorhizobium sp.]
MNPVARLLSLGRNFGFAVVLLVVLLAVNLILSPGRFQPGSWGALVGLAAPLIGAAIASTPVILAGRGGIDISVGPLMGFINALAIQVLFLGAGISSPLVLVPAALLVGALVGAANGFLATIVRIQPIVATLGTYLIPNIGPTYTLIAIAAVALGGVSLAGGRGGVAGAAIGAIDIFLLQSVLTTFNVSTFVLQIAYGAILVLAVMLTALQERLATRGR